MGHLKKLGPHPPPRSLRHFKACIAIFFLPRNSDSPDNVSHISLFQMVFLMIFLEPTTYQPTSQEISSTIIRTTRSSTTLSTLGRIFYQDYNLLTIFFIRIFFYQTKTFYSSFNHFWDSFKQTNFFKNIFIFFNGVTVFIDYFTNNLTHIICNRNLIYNKSKNI